VSSLDKPQKKLLVDLIENPFNALTLANKHDLVQILESVRKGVQSGSVSVKDITKSTSQIEEILSKLDSFIENVSNFDKSKTDLEDKLSIFDVKRLSQAENILKRHENEKSDFELKTKKLENEITDMIETLPKYRKSVMSILNEISAVQYSLKPE
jgi:chromosome segregation ATPase